MTDDDVFRGAEEPGEGYGWEEEPNLTFLSEEELRARLKELAEEERVTSYRRLVIQVRIDLIRAELVRRGGVALYPERLARVLLGGGNQGPEDRGSSLELGGGG